MLEYSVLLYISSSIILLIARLRRDDCSRQGARLSRVTRYTPCYVPANIKIRLSTDYGRTDFDRSTKPCDTCARQRLSRRLFRVLKRQLPVKTRHAIFQVGLNNDRDTKREIRRLESLRTCCRKALPIYGMDGSDSYCSKEALSYRFIVVMSYVFADVRTRISMGRKQEFTDKYPANENDSGQVLKPARFNSETHSYSGGGVIVDVRRSFSFGHKVSI